MTSDCLYFEFLTQLEASLDVDRPTALATLGDWLLSYEPVTPRNIEFLSKAEIPDVATPDLRRVA